jgi:photosystem II stability/assembly factor-like uncharacterized protein
MFPPTKPIFLTCCALSLGVFILTGCGPHGTGNQSSTSSTVQAGNEPATNTIAGELTRVQMIDAKTGWAISWDIAGNGAYHILRTTDGGSHWKTMLQCLSTQEDKTLYTTSDGWKHWATVSIQTTFTRIYGFDFVSPTLGWALADNRTRFIPAPGGGVQKGDMIALLQTTDGGKTWQEIAHAVV